MSDTTAEAKLPPVAKPPASTTTALPRRFEIRLSVALILGFGGLVFLAVASVIALGAWSARETTLTLLHDKSTAVMQQIVNGLELYLRPVENQLVHLSAQAEAGRLDVKSDDLGKYLAGALSATPEVRSLVFIDENGRMLRALRGTDTVDLAVIDVSGLPVIRGAFEEARARTGLFWGEVIRPETSDISTINVRRAVRRDGRFLGIFAATVQVDRLSQLLDDAARSLNGTAFILYDERFLLAHPRLIAGAPKRGAEILPTVADVGDKVIETFGSSPQGRRVRTLAERTGIRLIDVEGSQYALVASRLDRYGDKTWEVGVYFPADDLLAELSRLRWALAAGVAVLLVALLVAFGFSRYLTAPLNRLALAAQRISGLSLDQIERQPRGLFTEFNVAGQAFNSMVVGLRWFETYVPKKLVRRLVTSAEEEGTEGSLQYKERNVTVMFTDIAKFTSLSEAMPAESVAALLNSHFAVITGCIEAEGGTVDKFIGDCVMAFWGAPEKQKDHAGRACRAALAIAAAAKRENMAARAAGAPVLGVRIGLHSGPVIVGNIGAPGRINYTIIGDTVNTANRLEQMGKTLAPEAEAVIVLSGATLKSAGPDFDAKSVGVVSVRGRQGQVDVYVKEV